MIMMETNNPDKYYKNITKRLKILTFHGKHIFL